jgi:transcriptional regulator with XRE-family HTH domain
MRMVSGVQSRNINMQKVLRQIERRRRELGISLKELARRSSVSLPTLNRMVSGRHLNVSFASVLAVAETVGLELDARPVIRGEVLRRHAARDKAAKIVRMVQGTSALEGQGLGAAELRDMVDRTADELLTSNRRLWSE